MTTNYIDGMTVAEIRDECRALLGRYREVQDPYLTGLIIEKLQEWECEIRVFVDGKVAVFHPRLLVNTSPNIQRAFLLTAERLGHWHPPEPEKAKEPEFHHWRNKISGRIVDAMYCELVWPENWERVSFVPYKEGE